MPSPEHGPLGSRGGKGRPDIGLPQFEVVDLGQPGDQFITNLPPLPGGHTPEFMAKHRIGIASNGQQYLSNKEIRDIKKTFEMANQDIQ